MKLVDIQKPDIDYQNSMLNTLKKEVDIGNVINIVVIYETKDGTIEFSRCASSSLTVMGMCNLLIHKCCKTLYGD